MRQNWREGLMNVDDVDPLLPQHPRDLADAPGVDCDGRARAVDGNRDRAAESVNTTARLALRRRACGDHDDVLAMLVESAAEPADVFGDAAGCGGIEW